MAFNAPKSRSSNKRGEFHLIHIIQLMNDLFFPTLTVIHQSPIDMRAQQ